MTEQPHRAMTGLEYMAFVLKLHALNNHVDKTTCTNPDDCAATELLSEHPDTWKDLEAGELLAWVQKKKEEKDNGSASETKPA